MTFEISRRGKQYLKTAQTLLRAAQTMTDRVVADQLKALADGYQRRAEKASQVDAAKALARSAARAQAEWDSMIDEQLHDHPAAGCPTAGPITRFLPGLRSFESGPGS